MNPRNRPTEKEIVNPRNPKQNKKKNWLKPRDKRKKPAAKKSKIYRAFPPKIKTLHKSTEEITLKTIHPNPKYPTKGGTRLNPRN